MFLCAYINFFWLFQAAMSSKLLPSASVVCCSPCALCWKWRTLRRCLSSWTVWPTFWRRLKRWMNLTRLRSTLRSVVVSTALNRYSRTTMWKFTTRLLPFWNSTSLLRFVFIFTVLFLSIFLWLTPNTVHIPNWLWWYSFEWESSLFFL